MKQRESGLPFDDVRELVGSLPQIDEAIKQHTHSQLVDRGIDPQSGLGKLCVWYSAWSARSPAAHRPLATFFAGTHLVDEGKDQDIHKNGATEWLLEEVTSLSSGNSAVNRLASQHDLGVKIFDLALQIPVADISVAAALDEKSSAGTLAFGMEAIAGGTDLLCIAAIENKLSLSSVAILSVLNEDMDFLNLVPEALRKERLQMALALVQSHSKNPLEVLRRLGGRETAAICGAILAARSQHIPVLLGGYTALAAASILYELDESAIGHCLLAQGFQEPELKDAAEAIALDTVFCEPVTQGWGQDVILAAGMMKSACLLMQDAV